MFTSEARQFSILRIASEAGIELFEKKGRPDQYAANCPLCGDKRKRLNIHGSRDVFCCYNCGEKGGALKFYALLHNVSEDSAKETLRGDQNERFPQKTKPRHPVEYLSVSEIRKLGFVGKPVSWYSLRQENPKTARKIADWVWREKKQRDQKVNHLLDLLKKGDTQHAQSNHPDRSSDR